jgi:uncharacterized repeat protein (TIGR01451 family)
MGLMCVVLLGAYWAVSAQEGRPLWGPPPVLPTDETTKKPSTKYPNKAKADPTLIVPAEAFDVPRPVEPTEARKGFVIEEKPGIVLTGGALPPPMFPPVVTTPDPKQMIPPPLPVIDTKPLPMPILEPTKALIVEPATKEVPPKKGAIPLLLQSPTPVIPPPTVIPEPKKDLIAPPIINMPSVIVPEPKKEPIAPPTINMPSVIAPEPVAPQKSRAFVRIDSASNYPSPAGSGRPIPDAPILVPQQSQLPLPPSVAPISPSTSGLSSVQTPSVTVEKRGAGTLRPNETQSYQFVIRNLGPVPAQQVRIEDELPANVKIVSANPMPQVQDGKAVWVLSTVNVSQEQVIQLTLQGAAATELTGRTSVHVAATAQTTTTTLRPRNDAASMVIQVTGPNQVAVGKQAVFEIRVVNQSAQPLSGITLHGLLPDGLTTPQGQAIEGEVDTVIPPGESKTLKMPAQAVKAGHYTVAVKVTTQAGQEASATTGIDIAAESLQLQVAPATRLYLGRDGDLRLEVANHTSKSLRNVAVADRLPEGLDFVAASERGLYQANSRTVYWLIDQMPPGKTQTLVLRVNGTKAGQHQNVVFAKADGVGEMQSTGVVALEGISDLGLRVIERDNLLELGKETVYEIQVQNPGNAPSTNVQLQVQFPAGLVPKNAEGNAKFSLDHQSVTFEPIPSLGPQGQVIFRVTAIAHSVGDHRVRFAVASEQVRLPIQREINTKVYADKNP